MAVFLISGCLSDEGVYRYVKFDKRDFVPVADRAHVSFQSDRWFFRRGYRKISKIGVYQKISECYDTCKKISYNRSIYELLADEAAAKGGQYVQVTIRAKISKRKIKKKGDCIQYKEKWKTIYYQHCRGGEVGSGTVKECETRSRRKREKKCVQWSIAHGNKYVRWAFGNIWRKK